MVMFVHGLGNLDLERKGRHPYLGVVCLRDMIKMIYVHNHAHLRDVQKALIPNRRLHECAPAAGTSFQATEHAVDGADPCPRTGIARYSAPSQVEHILAGYVGCVCPDDSWGSAANIPHGMWFCETTEAAGAGIREAALYTSIAALAACGIVAFILYKDGVFTPPLFVSVGASLVLLLAYAVPPLRLLDRGFGELLLAINIAYLGPSTGFSSQGHVSSSLSVSAVSLTLLLLATLLVLDFLSHAEISGT
jgi:hypothetical protein